MFCVGLTGNIATGKSTVAEEFKKYGAELINADHIAKDLTLKGNSAYDKIVEHFGQSILLPEGQLDRKKLRQIIFSKPDEKNWLENLLHPLIRQDIEKQLAASKAPYVIVEIPLHFKRENFPYLDRVVLVTSPESEQIKRLMQRDHCDKEQAKAMLKNQPSLEKRMEIADDVIDNGSSHEALMKKIKSLHQKYGISPSA